MNDRDNLTDEEIAALVLEDKEIFAVLIERYEKKLARYVRRLGTTKKEDQEDILQNSFIKAYRNINDFDTKLSFSSWMYRIVHNETVSFFRAKSIRPEGNMIDDSEAILPQIQDELDEWEKANERINAEHLAKALSGLDDKYRNAIILRYFEGLDYEQISDILKIPSGSVATLIHRAKKKLSAELSHIRPVTKPK